MSVTTRRGDDGKSRFGGRVIDKDGCLLETIGTIDELMSLLGIVMMKNNNEIGKRIERINKDLYQIMGIISGYGPKEIELEKKIKYMDDEIMRMESEEETIENFLEAGKRLDEFLNWCRTVARRCERRVVALSKTEEIDKNILKYFNRLSDYLFILGIKTEE